MNVKILFSSVLWINGRPLENMEYSKMSFMQLFGSLAYKVSVKVQDKTNKFIIKVLRIVTV